MKHWQHYNTIEKLQLLDITSANTGLPRLAVEKDWWVTMVLKALTMTQFAHLISFKGGTSLSKGWHLIDRFSEDIDIALKRENRFFINGFSNTQLAKARRAARHYIVRELPLELHSALSSLGVSNFTIEPELSRMVDGKRFDLRADTHPSVLFVNYESAIPETSEYVQPRVKIEISCLSMDEPIEELFLNSFISSSVPESEDIEVKIRTVIPTRTFLEKMFLLHEEFQKRQPRSYRMSRHLYDLEKIMDTDFGLNALLDLQLYMDIVKHRSRYNKLPYVDYKTHQPQLINFLPPASVIKEWELDYDKMRNQFIYDSQKLSFKQILERMRLLQRRVREMKMDHSIQQFNEGKVVSQRDD